MKIIEEIKRDKAKQEAEQKRIKDDQEKKDA